MGSPDEIAASAEARKAAGLADPATRRRLSQAALEAMIRLAAIWRLTEAEARALLGDVSESAWSSMKNGGSVGALSQDALTRASALLGIFEGLRALYSEPLCDEWVRLPNNGPLY